MCLLQTKLHLLLVFLFGAATGKRGEAPPVAESLGLIVLLKKNTFWALTAHPLHLPPPNFGSLHEQTFSTFLHTQLGAGGCVQKVLHTNLELSITWNLWRHLPAR